MSLLSGLGEYIANVRAAADLSIDDLSARCGLPVSTLNALEAGNYDARTSELAAIAGALDMTIGRMLTRALPARGSSGRFAPLAYGTMVAVLLSGAVDEGSALAWKPDDPEPLVQAIHEPLRAFAHVAGSRKTDAPELINDYPGDQAERLGKGLVQRDRVRKGPVILWIPERARPAAVVLLARELVHALQLSADECAEALQAALNAYDQVESILVEAGRLNADGDRREVIANSIGEAVKTTAA